MFGARSTNPDLTPEEPERMRGRLEGWPQAGVIYVIYAGNVIYEAAVARTASSASGVSTSSRAAVSVGTSVTAS